jgi:farnesyl-diphosphate farnesyltransferase
VTIAYLLFRIADTLEDADELEAARRVEALEEFEQLLARPDLKLARAFAHNWGSVKLSGSDSCQELVRETPQVIEHLASRPVRVQQLIRMHARRTALGMVSFLGCGSQYLCSLAEVQKYCYYVAGVVGELLTDLFAEQLPNFGASCEVRSHAKAFGEGLQLVNILKDSKEDARCGRLFIPASIGRPALFDLARKDLRLAAHYVEQLRRAKALPGYLAFVSLPLKLAWATLDHVEREGPGAKLSRDEVFQILAELQAA